MRSTRQLVKVVHGSHLYGTSTPLSDLDYKGVHLPDGTSLVLQRPQNVIEGGVVAKEGTKNTADAIDYQSYSLQKFVGMLIAGDTVATEILFAPENSMVEMDPIWPTIQAQAKCLLNRQVKGFVGYCQRQAAKYGIKGSRMAAVNRLIQILVDKAYAAKMATIEPLLREFTEQEEHAEWKNIPSPNGSDLWHIVCCDRAMPMTATIGEAFKVYTKVWENYGERARAAMTNQGIDWKAVSHAVRVARQALELLQTGNITFPRPDSHELLLIKLGKVPYDQVSPMLEDLVQQVLTVESVLPPETPPALADGLIFYHYNNQIQG